MDGFGDAVAGAAVEAPVREAPILKRSRWAWPALMVIAAGAGMADAWNITTDGIEAYYAAGVRSMAGSWHDFLYGGFDPHGLITLDKLPGPFWAQALSVRIFGLSVWAMVLPQVVWSVLTVVVLFVAVRRVAGQAAGLAAAAIFAISPVTILSAHGNLGDPLFVLLSVLAADAVLRATRGNDVRWLMLAAVWIGLASHAARRASGSTLRSCSGACGCSPSSAPAASFRATTSGD